MTSICQSNTTKHNEWTYATGRDSKRRRQTLGDNNFVWKIKLSEALWRRGGKRNLNLNFASKKVNVKCWLAEMTLGMTSLAFQYLFTFALLSASRWLAEIWELSWRGATGELKVEFKFKFNSSLLPFPSPPPERSGQLARRLLLTTRTEISACKPNVNLFRLLRSS